MSIKHVDSFANTTFSNSTLRYEINAGIFAQGGIITGPTAPAGALADNSWWVFNTGFGMAEYTTRGLPARNTWTLNIWFRPLVAATGPQTQIWRVVDWFRFKDAAGTVFTIRQRADGKLELLNATGVSLHITSHVFTVGVWVALQLRVQFGLSGAWQLKLDGVIVASDSGLNLTIRQPDRFMHRWDSGAGLNLAHYVMTDELGARNAGFLPYPWFTTPLYPIENRSSGWNANVPTNSRAFSVADRLSNQYVTFPDGDYTYITPGAVNRVALFKLLASPCYGRNLAIAANVLARQTAPDQQLDIIVRESAVDRQIGQTIDLTNWTIPLVASPVQLLNYRLYQQITEDRDDAIWMDGDIDRGAWGLRAVTDQLRVSQFFLERVVAPGLSFKCGKVGHYAF